MVWLVVGIVVGGDVDYDIFLFGCLVGGVVW